MVNYNFVENRRKISGYSGNLSLSIEYCMDTATIGDIDILFFSQLKFWKSYNAECFRIYLFVLFVIYCCYNVHETETF